MPFDFDQEERHGWEDVEKYLLDQETTRQINEQARIRNERTRQTWEESTITDYVDKLCEDGTVREICRPVIEEKIDEDLDPYKQEVADLNQALIDRTAELTHSIATKEEELHNALDDEKDAREEGDKENGDAIATEKSVRENQYEEVSGRLMNLGAKIGLVHGTSKCTCIPFTDRYAYTKIWFPKPFDGVPILLWRRDREVSTTGSTLDPDKSVTCKIDTVTNEFFTVAHQNAHYGVQVSFNVGWIAMPLNPSQSSMGYEESVYYTQENTADNPAEKRITFAEPFDIAPLVNISGSQKNGFNISLKDVTTEGFTFSAYLDGSATVSPATGYLIFDWEAYEPY